MNPELTWPISTLSKGAVTLYIPSLIGFDGLMGGEGGIVEIDETFIGEKADMPRRRRYAHKRAEMSPVERRPEGAANDTTAFDLGVNEVGRPKRDFKTNLAKTRANRQFEMRLRDGIYYLAVSCKSCETPILFAISREKPRTKGIIRPGTRLLLVCVNEQCRKADIYESNEICSFVWRERRQEV